MNNYRDRGQDWKDNMLGERNTSMGDVKTELYRRYYDVSHTITLAGASNPNNQDDQVYNVENINDALQRNAPYINIANDGTDYLYVLVSHGGGQTFSPENIIYPGDIKTYINVYELRLRSPTLGLSYRVSEYDIRRTCCPEETTTIVKSTVQDMTLPAANSDFLTSAVVPTNPPALMLIEVAISVTGILSATIINGGNTQTVFFNSGTALVANSLYIFGLILHSGDTMNIRYSVTGGVIQVLRIDQTGEVV